MEPLIALAGVCKDYAGPRRVRALDHVNLSVHAGEMLAIVGASGSGKSTLMHVLGCLDAPTAGVYRLNGRAVETMSDRALCEVRGKLIGFVFQGFRLLPTLTALENVELPLLYRGVGAGERRARAAAALERVGLEHRTGHRPNELSGGQQQRVAIARAIVGRPALVLADEPTGNLDPRAGAQVVALLETLHAEGTTVIVITHDRDLARRLPRNVELVDGKISEA